MKQRNYTVVWTRTPISARDITLPSGVVPISVYPLARYMRAFDVFVGAAGYKSCCEVLQSRVPGLFVPNTMVNDDQTHRAEMVARVVPAVVSPCESPEQRTRAVESLLTLRDGAQATGPAFDLGGAEHAADEILGLIER